MTRVFPQAHTADRRAHLTCLGERENSVYLTAFFAQMFE